MSFINFVEDDMVMGEVVVPGHDLLSIVGSILSVVAAIYTAFLMLERVRSSNNVYARIAWLMAAAIVFGGGVWAMNFISMISMDIPGNVHYHVIPTLVSIVPAVFAGLLIMGCEVRSDIPFLRLIVCGFMIALSAWLVHQIGMSAVDMELDFYYKPGQFFISSVIITGLGVFSFWLKHRLKIDGYSQRLLPAAMGIGLAFFFMRYLGMASVNFHYGAEIDDLDMAWTSDDLLMMVALVVGFVLFMTIAAVFVSRKMDFLSRLKSSESRTKAIVATVLDGIVMVNDQGLIEETNPAMKRIFGYDADELIGRPVNVLMPGSDGEDHYNYIRECSEVGGDRFVADNCSLKGMHKDGHEFPIDLSVGMIVVDGRNMFVDAIHDMSQHKKIEEDLRKALGQAESANKAKSEFLATMSHEIRTPMNGLLGMLHLLKNTDLDKKQQRFVDTASGSGDMLLAVINDILDFSKMEAGKLVLESIPFNISALVEETAILLAGPAHDKGLEFVFSIDPHLPDLVRGDPTRIRQVLTNLITNAIKFTDKGEILVLVKERNNQIYLSVIDTGIGMDDYQQESIFNAFTQADSSTTRKYGGTGLGLPICKRLVKEMGGMLNVESTKGFGSSFSFSLPLEVVRQHRTDMDLHGVLADKRILIVDDNETNRDVLTNILDIWDVEVAGQADSGEAALAKLREAFDSGNPYDIALLDMHMPGMDGHELARLIRDDSSLRAIHLVMLSSLDRDVGMPELDTWLTKPVRQSDLYNSLLYVLGEREITEKPERRVVPTGKDFWFGGRRLLLVEDNEINQEVASEILMGAGFSVDVRGDGEMALLAVKERSYDAVLMDIQMPIMDGLEAARQIRALGGDYLNLPIIAMTANALSEDRRKSIEAGMNAHVTKPINPDEVFMELSRWFDLSEKSTDEEQPGAMTKSREFPELPGIDIADVVQRFGDDLNLYKKIAFSYRKKHSGAVDIIRELVAKDDWAEASRYAHNLKGTSGIIGAVDVFKYASEIEVFCKDKNEEMVAKGLISLGDSLKKVVAGIDDLEKQHGSSSKKEEFTGRVIDNGNVSGLLKKITFSLDTDIAEAQACLEELQRYVQGSAHFSQLKEIEVNLNRFDIDACKAGIDEFKKAIA